MNRVVCSIYDIAKRNEGNLQNDCRLGGLHFFISAGRLARKIGMKNGKLVLISVFTASSIVKDNTHAVLLIKSTKVTKSISRHHCLVAFLFGFLRTLCLILIVTFFSTAYAMSQDKEEVTSYVGVIQKVEGVSITMAGKYKLMDGERFICLLISREINLDVYINHKVKVTGMPKVAVEGGSAALMVVKVEPLN